MRQERCIWHKCYKNRDVAKRSLIGRLTVTQKGLQALGTEQRCVAIEE